MKYIRSFIIIFLFILVFDCVTADNPVNNDRKCTITGINLSEYNPANLPDTVLLAVTYIPQNDGKSCATTSVAMAISFYENLNDKPLDKETVWKISGTDENTVRLIGNDMSGLARIAGYYGYKSEFAMYMSLNDVEFLLSQKVLVVLNIRVSKYGNSTHAILVTGYDKNKKIFRINDPANKNNKTLEISALMARWSANLSSPRGMSYRSGFIIYPKNLNAEK